MHVRTLNRPLTVLGVSSLLASLVLAQPGGQTDPKGNGDARQPAGERGQRGPGERGQRGPGGENRGASLEGAMKSINRALRTLKDQIGDASKKDENLGLVNDMQRGCIAAKGAKFELHGDAKHTPEELASLAKKYRSQMIALARELLALEELVIDGKGDAAREKLDAIVAMRDKAHKEFGVKDD